ncbi:4-demethylwyosine synthase TYW1 [Fervidicoccus fontis]|nr:4-demethylwyosine synthase TYW1 [Fervidicoccus fontis]PMB76848.1 MAG: 4-demethylwyosine synthase TYW1 [Fervidicoccus fontis]HEW63619.1 4-demethylwyosine synthase TYW1 [Fervidicoccus fontis]
MNVIEKKENVYDILSEVMKKQGYHFVDSHTTLKTCSWTRNALTQRRFCYKCKFYGIESHRCIQMSPAAFWCWNACVHCWRLRPSDTGLKWNEVKMPDYNDDVKRVVDRLIEEQRKMLSGYKDHKNVDKKMFEEAMDPKHVAISLTGEPTLYNKLEDLIMEFHRRGMTTFLVTRGVRPDVILNLKEKPSQLYISMEAYNKEMYEWLNQPLVPNAWELTMETLKGLPEYGRPTVLRITLMKGINMDEKAINGFAKIVEIMQPTYIEPKGYMYVGASMLRLSRDNMPTHDEVRKFAEELSKATGYPIRSESKPSRIVLLSKLDKPIRFGKGCPEGWNSEY